MGHGWDKYKFLWNAILWTTLPSSKQWHFSAELLPHKAEVLPLPTEKESALLASCWFGRWLGNSLTDCCLLLCDWQHKIWEERSNWLFFLQLKKEVGRKEGRSQQKAKKVRKGKANNADLLLSWPVNWYRLSNKKSKKQGQGKPGCWQFLCLATNLLKPKKEAEKQRGCIVVCLLLLLRSVIATSNDTKKQRRADCQQFDWLSLWSSQMLGKPKKVRKGKANNANLSFGWHVNWYWQPTIQIQKMEAEKQRRRGCLVVHLILLQQKWHQKQQRRANYQRFDQLSLWSSRMLGKQKKERESQQCQPFIWLVCQLVSATN